MSRSRNISKLIPDINGKISLNTQVKDRVSSSGMPAGTVLQVKQSVKTDIISLSGDWGNIGLNVSITPLSIINKIYIVTNLTIGVNSTTVGFRLQRNGMSICLGNYGGAIPATQIGFVGNNEWMGVLSHSFLDTPNSISELTYGIIIRSYEGRISHINRSGGGPATDGYLDHGVSTSTITAMEIAG